MVQLVDPEPFITDTFATVAQHLRKEANSACVQQLEWSAPRQEGVVRRRIAVNSELFVLPDQQDDLDDFIATHKNIYTVFDVLYYSKNNALILQDRYENGYLHSTTGNRELPSSTKDNPLVEKCWTQSFFDDPAFPPTFRNEFKSWIVMFTPGFNGRLDMLIKNKTDGTTEAMMLNKPVFIRSWPRWFAPRTT